MTDRVVMKDGRAGRLIETTARGYRVMFVSAETYEIVEVRDADVSLVQYDWPLYVTELEESAAQVYVARAQSRQEMTVEWWERIVHRFPASARHSLHTAELILTGEYDGE